MCLVSYGSKTKWISFPLLSVSLFVGSACLCLCRKHRKPTPTKMCFISVPYKEELRILRQIILMNRKNLCKCNPRCVCTRTTDHLWFAFCWCTNDTSKSLCVCLPLFTTAPWEAENPGFHCTTFLPPCPTFHHTQVGVSPSCSTD